MTDAQFSWMTPTQPRKNHDRRVAMYHSELSDRARLLRRLNYTKDQCFARLQANLEWDFDAAKSEISNDDINRIVTFAFSR